MRSRRGGRDHPQQAHETTDSRERELKHARQQLSTAKVVVTLSVAIAATFVSTAYKKVCGHWDEVGVLLMLVTLVLTVVIVAFAPTPPRGDVDDTTLTRFKCWASWAHWLMVVQVFTSSLSVVAVILVERPDWASWI
jgi:hypothetical protein